MKRGLKTRVLSCVLIVIFLLTSVAGPVGAQSASFLPEAGTRVSLSPAVVPPLLTGVKIYADNPFKLDFLLSRGAQQSNRDFLKKESTRLIKYFLASLTVPEKDLWVNLNPKEPNRIVPDAFGRTEMGRDLLAQDYLLKQIVASLMYPEGEIGKTFWDKIYKEAYARYGTTDISVDTLNKVWIVPDKAVVYENPLPKSGEATAFVVESKLKVMLEEDYLALPNIVGAGFPRPDDKGRRDRAPTKIVKEILLPAIEKEVNTGKNFAQLRQVYNSLILATWYKKKIQDSILSQMYVDKKKVAGINIDDPKEIEKIWTQYVETFKKGAYQYLKEEYDPVAQAVVPRKYFSGGITAFELNKTLFVTPNFSPDAAMLSNISEVEVDLVPSENQTGARKPAVSLKTEFHVSQNTVGVYGVGALSVSFFERMNADHVIMRPNSPTSQWVSKSGALKIDGQLRDIKPNILNGLVNANQGVNRLPEVIMVAPYANQLQQFQDDLMAYFEAMDKNEDYQLDHIPYFLLASSGIYLENFRVQLRDRIEKNHLKNKEFFFEGIDRRLFRAVAYQSGTREGSGVNSNYIVGKEDSYIVLSRNGLPEDRARIMGIIRARNYTIKEEEVYLRAEFNKAFVTLMFNALNIAYAYNPIEHKLSDVRLGDLFSDSESLPQTFKPHSLGFSSSDIRARMLALGDAFIRIGQAKGIYGADQTVTDLLRPLEKYLTSQIPTHSSSSYQFFREKLLDPNNGFPLDSLFPTETFLIDPLIDWAKKLHDKEAEEVFQSLKTQIIEVQQKAVGVREDLDGVLERLGRGDFNEFDKEILKYWVKKTMRSSSGLGLQLSDMELESYFEFLIKGYQKSAGADLLQEIPRKELWNVYLPFVWYLNTLKTVKGWSTITAGFSALPGVGKSTFVNKMKRVIEVVLGEQVLTLSIDDLYIDKNGRDTYGFSRWGPGTHDLRYGAKLFHDLKNSTAQSKIFVRRFDKTLRDGSYAIEPVNGKVSFILFEGFAVGIKTQGYDVLSGQVDVLVDLKADIRQAKEWRRGIGWENLSEKYKGDRDRFNEDFEKMWAVLEKQTLEVSSEVDRNADFFADVGDQHAISSLRKNQQKPHADANRRIIKESSYRSLIKFLGELKFKTTMWDRNLLVSRELSSGVDQENLAYLVGYGMSSQKKFYTLMKLLEHADCVDAIKRLSYEQFQFVDYIFDGKLLSLAQEFISNEKDYNNLKKVVEDQKLVEFMKAHGSKKFDVKIRRGMVFMDKDVVGVLSPDSDKKNMYLVLSGIGYSKDQLEDLSRHLETVLGFYDWTLSSDNASFDLAMTTDKKSVYILLGLPASGKGTAGALLSKELGIPALSFGETVRQLKAKELKEQKSIDERTVLDYLESVIKNQPERFAHGFIFDISSRVHGTYEILEKMLERSGFDISKVIHVRVNKDIAHQRLLKRGDRGDGRGNKDNFEFRVTNFFNRITLPTLIAAQKSKKLFILDNNGTENDLLLGVKELAQKIKNTDQAMSSKQGLAQRSTNMPLENNGGIDLTAANMNLQTQSAGEGIRFRLDPVILQQLKNSQGFVPVIINIHAMPDVKLFLGLSS
ncbi:MAG: nucleoside monophosphate kinase [Candidatus Omnitrophica bacterium]|nr:nucleoside monophosphate kinase [Candidatus Omnitrophota bacterium]